ncbi:4-carboxy-4-hydroxy-2-oxoadipate aldolase/oxaloacetate decarboxylase [Actinophytocola sp.]|uniref:4-carboxy-4-hydroxy-2-oxoadipate aldolase/oxaloacetate decarboxylase n=1 Tax=Actinophytocola sp. TaxID=1872138 RepID=UPI0038999D90
MAAHYVVRSVERADAGTIAALGEAGVATAHEVAGRVGLLGPEVRPRQDGAVIAGSAITVSCHPGDNLMIHAAVEVCRPGDVLVVTTTSPSTDGMFGDLLATSLMSRGVLGIVIDAGVRDIASLREMGFPVWSRAVHAQGTVKASPGSVNVPVVVAGRLVRPGDIVVADDDGVLALPAATGPAVVAAAARRTENERTKREKLAGGTLGVDLYDLRPLLAKLGVEYVDRLPEGGGA